MTAEIEARVREVLAGLVTAMVPDGGGAEIVALGANSITLALQGSCCFCPSRDLSAAALARRLREGVPELTDVRIIVPPFRRPTE